MSVLIFTTIHELWCQLRIVKMFISEPKLLESRRWCYSISQQITKVTGKLSSCDNESKHVPSSLLDIEIFSWIQCCCDVSSKVKIPTSRCCQKRSQGIITPCRLLPLGTTNVCTKCNGNTIQLLCLYCISFRRTWRTN